MLLLQRPDYKAEQLATLAKTVRLRKLRQAVDNAKKIASEGRK
jgi:hypothetical protein